LKILLVGPPQSTRYLQPPLGLAMLASVLEKEGHMVKIVDLTALGLSENAIPQIIHNEKPEVVGITAMTSTINSAIRVARKVKESDSHIWVVLGGAHASILPEQTLQKYPELDIIVRGEGETTIIELVEAIERNVSDLGGVLGLTYRTESGVKSNQSRPPLLDLDKLPFPAFHLLPPGKYRLHPPFGRKYPAMPVMISRGCPYSCIFCSKSVFGNKYRNNSPVYVVNQIRLLIEKFGIKEIKFYDDVFTLDRKWVMAICTEMKNQRIVIPWTCETRVNLVDTQMLRTMNDAGCYMIAYGVESGDQKILTDVGKNVRIEQIVKAFNLTHEVGISTVGYFMFGSPNETPETIKRTIEFAKKLNPDFAQFSIATPYPGTELNRIATEKGCMPEDWDGYVYADLRSVRNSAFEISNINSEELRIWSKKAYTSFYLRWGYIWKKLKKIRSLDDLKANISGLSILKDLLT
jgi:anaerobic magnesium-protoporphyrin IX monomethyl ester cyclase